MSGIFWTALLLLAIYIALAGLVYLVQDRLVYFPQSTLSATPAAYGLPYEDVNFEAGDGVDLHGWYVPADESRFTLLFFHGNGGNISGRLDTITLFHSMGLDIFIIDYRGYGRSEGTPSEEGTYRDAEAAWDYLVSEKNHSPDSIIVMGRSLGGAVAAWLAGRKRPRALILESTFSSGVELARAAYPFFPVGLMLKHRYPTAEHIQDLEIPKLFAHSPEDDVVPYELGRKLYQGAPGPKTFLEMRGRHNNAFQVTGKRYRQAIEEFLSSAENRFN